MSGEDDNPSPPDPATRWVELFARVFSELAAEYRADVLEPETEEERRARRDRAIVREAFDSGYRAAMHYAEQVAGEPVLLDSAQIARAWRRYLAESDSPR